MNQNEIEEKVELSDKSIIEGELCFYGQILDNYEDPKFGNTHIFCLKTSITKLYNHNNVSVKQYYLHQVILKIDKFTEEHKEELVAQEL